MHQLLRSSSLIKCISLTMSDRSPVQTPAKQIAQIPTPALVAHRRTGAFSFGAMAVARRQAPVDYFHRAGIVPPIRGHVGEARKAPRAG